LRCVQLVWMHHGVSAIFHSNRFPRFGVLFIGLIRTPGRHPTKSAPCRSREVLALGQMPTAALYFRDLRLGGKIEHGFRARISIIWHLERRRKHDRRPPITMPTALRIGPFRFYLYSYDCREPRHMHVDRENRSAKFWLDPDVTLAANHGYNRRELREIERMMREHLETLRNEWDGFCSGVTHPA
jgi:Domain of unknown function (DUF4160)